MASQNYARTALGYPSTEQIDAMSGTVFNKKLTKSYPAITCPTSANESSTWRDFKLINGYVEKYT